MAVLADELWKHNVAKVTIVDVTEDYVLMMDPLPSEFYPVLKEIWLPRYKLAQRLLKDDLIQGYYYDWHEAPLDQGTVQHWFVGVVNYRRDQPNG